MRHIYFNIMTQYQLQAIAMIYISVVKVYGKNAVDSYG